MTSAPTSIRISSVLEGRLGFATILFAALLIVYLPLEPAVLQGLGGSAYWLVRLLPDGIIAVGTIVAFVLDRSMPRKHRALLLGLAGVVLLLTAANYARGYAPNETVNALRVVVRYLPLGILVWRYSGLVPGARSMIVSALVTTTVLQVLAGVFDLIARIPNVFSPGSNGWQLLLLIDGTTGRYDRYGMLLAGSLILLLALARHHVRPWHIILGLAAVTLLMLSTSRQAMMALAIVALAFAFFPAVVREARVLSVVIAALAALMILSVPKTAVAAPPDDVPQPSASVQSPEQVPTSRGATAFSLDPNRNFRLYLTFVLMPWAATQEPLLGFGPGQQAATVPDARLSTFVEESRTDWGWVRRFTNDSNYASLVLQFGVVLPLALLLLVGVLVATALRSAWLGSSFALFAIGFAAAVAIAAALGPAFEIRTTSSVLWVSLFAALQVTVEGSNA
jgi:hypothetical protein